jgi:hypothetical protein
MDLQSPMGCPALDGSLEIPLIESLASILRPALRLSKTVFGISDHEW